MDVIVVIFCYVLAFLPIFSAGQTSNDSAITDPVVKQSFFRSRSFDRAVDNSYQKIKKPHLECKQEHGLFSFEDASGLCEDCSNICGSEDASSHYCLDNCQPFLLMKKLTEEMEDLKSTVESLQTNTQQDRKFLYGLIIACSILFVVLFVAIGGLAYVTYKKYNKLKSRKAEQPSGDRSEP